MIRKSNHSKDELIKSVGQRVQAFQDATDEVDEAVSKHLALNRSDLRCLSVLSQGGTMSASALADAAGLTRGAMTTALDRIEAVGYARRVRDSKDRRSVRVELTEAAQKVIAVLYGPMANEGFRLLQTYTEQELAAVAKYLQDGRQLQRAHAQRIRALADTDRAAHAARRRRRDSAPVGRQSRSR